MFSRNSFLSQIPPVTLNLIIINIIVWLACQVIPTIFNINLVGLFGMHYWQADQFYFFQMFTYMFLHDTGSLNHLFFNMFALFMFGRFLENIWGSKKYLLYYLLTGVGAGIVQQIVWSIELMPIINSSSALTYSAAKNLSIVLNQFITIGASGSVFGLLLAFGWLFPNMEILLFFIIPIKAKFFVFLYGVIELFAGVANFSGDSVAHFAHLGGMLFGAALLYYWQKKGALYR